VNRQTQIFNAMVSSVVWLILASTAKGDPIPSAGDGTVVLLTSSSGKQLSAWLPETIKLSTNSSEWEQWKYTCDYINCHFMSFHGTALTVTLSKAFHTPGLRSEGLVVKTAAVTWNASHTAFSTQLLTDQPSNGSSIVIFDAGKSRILTEGGGGVTSSQFYSALIPSEAVWTITVVGSPGANRVPVREPLAAIPARRYNLMNPVGNYLAADPIGGSTSITAIHQRGVPTRAVEPVWMSSTETLHFGDSISLKLVDSFSSVFLKPGILSGGYKSVVASDGQSSWTLVPIAPYENGNRVPVAVNLMLRSAEGTFLSADPIISPLRLSSTQGKSEMWAFSLRAAERTGGGAIASGPSATPSSKTALNHRKIVP
jgi:hypothetical protein